MQTSNYRGISLTSVIGKLFERIILKRITPVLKERGIPHYTQTAFQSGISCADPTEVVQEAVRSYIQDGSMALQCFYDLEKAFDSVEYCVLLHHLFRSGINGKTWRIIRSFYTNPRAQVRSGNGLSEVINLERGVRQGSVLSPLLFLLVMDSLLIDLAHAEAGVSINGIYTGSLCHADDLRSIAPNMAALEKQVDIIKSFTEANSLKLNLDKLELLEMSRGLQPPECTLSIGTNSVSSTATAKCLGTIWSHNMSPKFSIENNINKARRAFFGLGSLGIFHGKQNPLTSSEVFEVCVLSVCLYGCENWLLTEPLLLTLEAFQAEIGKRILNLPKHHSNLIPLIALRWPTMRYRILTRKLSFLHRLMKSQQSTISAKVFESMKHQIPGPLIIDQCKFLEEVYKTNITATIVEGGGAGLKKAKKALNAEDIDYIWSQVEMQNSLRSLSSVISWPKLWDMARDRGIQGSRSLTVFLKVLTTPIFKDLICPFCNHVLTRDSIFAEHISTIHLSQPISHLISILENADEEHIFQLGSRLKRLYATAS